MSLTLIDILAYTCVLPALVGLPLYNKMEKYFHLLLHISLLAFVTEILTTPSVGINKLWYPLIINLFVIVNTLLHILFFQKASIISSKKKAAGIFTAFLIFVAVNMVFQHVSLNADLFPSYLASYAIILILCIEAAIKQTYSVKLSWYKDPVFLFATINVIYAAFFLLIYGIRFLGLPENNILYNTLKYSHSWVNAACNVLTIWPIICTAKKSSYIKLLL